MLPIAPLAFGFGGPQDWVIIAVVALLVFGPKKLPEVGRQLGQAMREFNKLKDEVMGAAHSIQDEVASVYEPVVKPYSQSHPVSSATVDAAAGHRVYDQDPVDMMAPVVPHAALPEKIEDESHELALAEASAPVSAAPVSAAPVSTEGDHEKGL